MSRSMGWYVKSAVVSSLWSGVQWGCWISYHPGSAWGRRRSMFCVWDLTTAAKQPSSTNSNHLMWVHYDGSLHGRVSDSFLTVCCQHSSLLGPFSEEWKHVSQVKDIMYFLLLSSPLCHTFVISSVFICLFVCFFVCAGQTQTQEIVPTIGFNIEKFKSSR